MTELPRIRRRPTECTVQAALYMRCMTVGIEVELEASLVLPGGRYLRADLAAVTEGSYAYALVEVKRTQRQGRKLGNRQSQRYDSIGLPWIYCRGMNDVEATVSWLQTIDRAYLLPK